ncbi:molybdate ABC transporter substrate-binding protein [Tropicimonas sp. IMCC34043]|uniref:molybdate ABC transporter substrate-binding protein n=1 Tax=Tropicimonas sp. IMCC34043 TaxID=2248760 RepID=UPI000E24E77A|nr:molybdate ABC transporter substrate-binding protein [Tropicimonas sp. IMCC34043]
MNFSHPALRSGVCALALLIGTAAQADEILVAVAANFTAAAKDIGTAFTAATGHTVSYSFGSTGQLYTQITQDAPFEVFLAADQARPEKAEAEGFAVPDTRFTYATGKLLLWSADPETIDGTPDILSSPDLTHVSYANPQTAPYGAAAVETMQALGLYDALKPRLVEGKSISQAQQFVATGNAEVGFVALSQVIADDSGSSWLVPDDLYSPIRQDAVLLVKGGNNEAAKAYLAFLQGAEALSIIEGYGYGVGQ